ncbi:MAG: hypothetical protein AABY83_08615 [Pseudomonadota bacterium]
MKNANHYTGGLPEILAIPLNKKSFSGTAGQFGQAYVCDAGGLRVRP